MTEKSPICAPRTMAQLLPTQTPRPIRSGAETIGLPRIDSAVPSIVWSLSEISVLAPIAALGASSMR